MTARPLLQVDVRLPLDRFELLAQFRSDAKVTGLFGPSGSGKSSLLEAMAGLRPQAEGVVRLGERTWLDSPASTALRPEERGVGYVPQDGLLLPDRSVRANLRTGRARSLRSGLDFDGLFRRVTSLLEIEPLLDQHATALSGGERQRVALGRALCSGPDLLILDEPLAALDLALRRRLLVFLRRIQAELDVPWLFVSHDPFEMQALCDEVVVLHVGKVVAQGPPHTVLRDPAVFGLVEGSPYETVLPATLVAAERGSCRVRLDGGLEIVTGSAGDHSRQGEPLLIGLPANEVILATQPPVGLSARNVLPASIVELQPSGGSVLVLLRLNSTDHELAAEVTQGTVQSMNLGPGTQLHAVFKATSCRAFSEKNSQASPS